MRMSHSIITTYVLWMIALAVVAEASTTLRPVPYRDVKSIVLDSAKQTLGRRSTVPQMKYVGNDGRYAGHFPTTMQCRNEGWDGSQFTWACQAQLPNGVDLDRVEVVCEDWDPPVNDAAESDVMTAGSCGVEYTLRGTPPAPTHVQNVAYQPPTPPVVQHVVHSPAQTFAQHNVHHPPVAYQAFVEVETPLLVSHKQVLGGLLLIVILLFLIVCCIACDTSSRGSSRRSSPPSDDSPPIVVETTGDTTYVRPLRRSQRHVVVEQPAPVYVAPAPAPSVYVAPAPAPSVYVAPAPSVYVAPAPATVVIDNRSSNRGSHADGFIDGIVTGALWNWATTPSRSSSSSSSSWGGGGSSVTTNIFHSSPAPSPSPSASSTHSSSAFGGTKRR